jgi:hypothetical protein
MQSKNQLHCSKIGHTILYYFLIIGHICSSAYKAVYPVDIFRIDRPDWEKLQF